MLWTPALKDLFKKELRENLKPVFKLEFREILNKAGPFVRYAKKPAKEPLSRELFDHEVKEKLREVSNVKIEEPYFTQLFEQAYKKAREWHDEIINW